MGLVVLIILLAYMLFSIGIAVAAHFVGKRKGWKWCKWWTALLAMIVIPTWDIPLGRLYFKHLCNTEAGMFVYQTVQLPEEYFLRAGERDDRYIEKSPFAYAKGGEVRYKKIAEKYDVNRQIDHSGYWNGRIKKMITRIRGEDANTLLSEAVSFFYVGGWVVKLASDPIIIHDGSPQCPSPGDYMQRNIHDEIVEKTFFRIQ